MSRNNQKEIIEHIIFTIDKLVPEELLRAVYPDEPIDQSKYDKKVKVTKSFLVQIKEQLKTIIC